jgi:signal transduction histidine kinase
MEKQVKKIASLRISLFIYMSIALIAAQLLYTLALTLIESVMLGLMSPTPDAIAFKGGRNIAVWLSNPMPSGSADISNQALFDALRTLRSICPVVIFGVCIVIATYFFYRIKIKKPLDSLTMGVEKIAKQELDFTMRSDLADELGRLCNAFEEMRSQLAGAFHSLWASEENQRSLYRAFAHDLRTPLTVIKGNNELIELVAAKNNDWAQATEAVTISNQAIGRIETYANQLKSLDSIDDLVPNITKIDLRDFIDVYGKEAQTFAASFQKKLHISLQQSEAVSSDGDIIIRVLDNLLSNAFRHARQVVWLNIALQGSGLTITVSDDGEGFSGEALVRAKEPFFSSDKSKHMGIGLTIADRLLSRLNSALQISNRSEGGATVKFILEV